MRVTAVACGAPSGPARRKEKKDQQKQAPDAVDSMQAHPRGQDEDQEMLDTMAEGRRAEGRTTPQTLASPAPVCVLLACSASRHPLAVEGRVGDHMKQGPLAPFP